MTITNHYLLALIGALLPALAIAQGAVDNRVLEEVTVTAQKRSESLQDVPLSVAVVSGDELAALGSTQIQDLSRLVPGLTINSSAGDTSRSIRLRGIGTQTFSRGVEQSVGMVIDGVVASSVMGSILDYSDVDRIEVLRGPQGMLFGKNASAGVLSISTRNPTEDFSAGLGATYGEENLLLLNGYLSGPLVDESLLGRVAAYSNSQDPILDNEYPGGQDFNDRDEWGIRGKLHWLPTDELDAQLVINHVDRDYICCVSTLVQATPGSIAEREGGITGRKNDRVFENDTVGLKTRIDMYSLELNYQWKGHILTSISAYGVDKIRNSGASDLYGLSAIPINISDEEYEQFTQEIRVTSPADQALTYVAGLYYFDNDVERDFVQSISLAGADIAPAGFFSVTNDTFSTKESYAAFGQLTWHHTDSLRVSVGARYNDDEVSSEQTVGSLPGTIPTATPGTVKDKIDEQKWSWRIIGEWDFTDSAMAYASVARGYKGPGVNTLPSGPSNADELFVDPEIPTSYEIGLKSQWMDNRLRVNATAYYTEFKDFQASVITLGSLPPEYFLDNAGELETTGIELEVNALVTERLTLQAAVAYTDATFSDWGNAQCYEGQTEAQGCIDGRQDLSGSDLPYSPDWALNLGGSYRVPLETLPFEGFARWSYYWRDDVQFLTTNDPNTVGDSYGTLDLYLGIAADDGRYTANFWVRNAFDEFYVLSEGGVPLVGVEKAHSLAYDYKRRFGVAFTYNF
jgi:iron complex outermembrane receptor protein